MIYLIADQQKQWCKIGYSVNPIDRMRSIQTGMPFSIQILYVVEGSFQDEKVLHKKYKNKYIRGEWFEYCNEIVESIKEMKQLPITECRSIRKPIVISQETAQKVYNQLSENYQIGADIAVTKQLRVNIGNKLNLNERTILNTLAMLCDKEKPLLYSVTKGIYKINPRYAYKGSTTSRNRDLKVILELECPHC